MIFDKTVLMFFLVGRDKQSVQKRLGCSVVRGLKSQEKVGRSALLGNKKRWTRR